MKSLKRAPLAAALVGIAMLGLGACSQPYADSSTRTEDGKIAEGGEVGVYKLQVGDCVNDPTILDPESEADEVASYEAVPCEQTHTGEVISVDDEFFAAEDAYPGEEVVVSRSTEACVSALVDYTGVGYEDSNYDAFPLYPVEDGWNSVHDRGISCIGATLSENTWLPIESTTSMKAAA